MTVSRVVGLLQANKIIGKEDKAATTAIKSGQTWIANEFRLENPPHTLYNFDVIAALGPLSG